MVIKKVFDDLSNREVWEIAMIRTNVFSIEQNIKEVELEELDYKAIHYFIKQNNIVVSYARVVEKNNTIKLGRVCTDLKYRNQGLQTKIIKKVISQYNVIELSAQLQTLGFYEKLGFKAIGEIYLEANIKHQKMIYIKGK